MKFKYRFRTIGSNNCQGLLARKRSDPRNSFYKRTDKIRNNLFLMTTKHTCHCVKQQLYRKRTAIMVISLLLIPRRLNRLSQFFFPKSTKLRNEKTFQTREENNRTELSKTSVEIEKLDENYYLYNYKAASKIHDYVSKM